MAFSGFSTAASRGLEAAPAQPSANVMDGPELREVQTNDLGFSSLNGEAKVQLFPTPWPLNDLPPPSSSLLSIASKKQLLAAAGPEALYLASTTKVREAFQSATTGDTPVRQFTPEIKLALAGLTHVAFTADESFLVASQGRDGGIVAFQVDRVVNNQLDPAVQIPTGGQGLRALVPNPSHAPESAGLCALITTNGDLMLLDLHSAQLRSGSNGQVLQNGASCLSWSKKGKQLLAGLADGTAVQLRPDGTIVASIPKPASLPPSLHVSGLVWLENDAFLIIYSSSQTNEGIQPSEYYIVHRQPDPAGYVFQKLPEVLPPFGVERLPPSHFITRLSDFKPHLQDVLIVAATSATDVGIISTADKPLSQEEPVTNAFTLTAIEEDARRAQLPLSPDMQDTSPVGMALDLSSTDKVPNPLPSDPGILETAGPVPALMILNNEGVLVSWWIIYNDSVREGTTYSGFDALPSSTTSQPTAGQTPQPLAASPAPTSTPTFTSSPLRPATSSFGTATGASSFGAPSPRAFGESTPIAPNRPSWASTGFGAAAGGATNASGFGQPAFGAATPIGGGAATFGAPAALGSRAPAFGAPAFGQTSSLSGSNAAAQPSPFAGPGASAGSGFASFSKGGGFSSFGADQKSSSPFGSTTKSNIFGTPAEGAFGSQTSTASPFASKAGGGQGLLGATGGFQLQSSFRGDGTAKDDLPKPKEVTGFGFGASLGDMLGESKKALSPTHDQEQEMDEGSDPGTVESHASKDTMSDDEAAPPPRTKPVQNLVTPPATLTQPKVTHVPPVSNLFGQVSGAATTPQPQPAASTWSFNAASSTTPKETPAPAHLALFGKTSVESEKQAAPHPVTAVTSFKDVPEAPAIKEESPSDEESVDLAQVPEAPLPPNPISKPNYTSGDTSASSNASKTTTSEDAPLPPDFLPAAKAGTAAAGTEHPELPSDDDEDHEDGFSSDFEGSGEDVTGDVSHDDYLAEEHPDHLQTSPESSFKSDDHTPEVSPTGGLFTKVSSMGANANPARPLFGEVGTGPVFVPPKPQESPRSPSPVRRALPVDGLRSDASRSVSAPAHPRSIVNQRKVEYQQSALAAQAAKAKEDEMARANARREMAARQKAQTEAEQLEPLEDDEDERLQQELARPSSPTPSLDEFITYQPTAPDASKKTGIPAQIERLYSDINSMVYTLGINCRSLSAFMRYQQPDATNESWPGVLSSETPVDALNDEWFLADVARLHQGQSVLSSLVEQYQVDDFVGKTQQCQALIGHDLFDLHTKLNAVRRTMHQLSTSNTLPVACFSAEQASIQNDLRKAFTLVQTKLVQVEDCITVLRAKLAQYGVDTSHRRPSALGRTSSQKKPTVEAVTKTVGKMMSMAEQKSADIDVLEAQLKKINLSQPSSAFGNGDASARSGSLHTPQHMRPKKGAATPASSGSIYHTPDSKLGHSTRSNKSLRASQLGGLAAIAAEDRERWKSQARRRKEAASMLRGVLAEKRTRTVL